MYLKDYFEATEENDVDALYLRCKKGGNGYGNAPLGQHMIEKAFKEILVEGGYEGKYTLHRLRRTGASRLFQAGVPEKVIQQHTGHASIAALAEYTCVNDQQVSYASSAMAGGTQQALPAIPCVESSSPVPCTSKITQKRKSRESRKRRGKKVKLSR